MTENHLVSIVLPTYNGGRYIKQSIDSCLRQTYKNIELVVVDDGSSDSTADIVKSYSDPRVKYFKHEKSLKLPMALNTGFKNAKGGYLSWTSDDNFYKDNAIEVLFSALEFHQDVDFVYSNFYYINEMGKVIKKVKVSKPENLEMKNCVGACFLYRRRVYEEVGDYNPMAFLAEDYEYWLRVRKKFKLKKINDFLYYYRIHPESLSSRNRAYEKEERSQKASHPFVRSSIKHYHKGKFLFIKGDYKNAKKILFEAMKIEPFNGHIIGLLIFCAMLDSLKIFRPIWNKNK